MIPFLQQKQTKTDRARSNNVVLMFSPTEAKKPYEQEENRRVMRFSR